MCCQEFLDGRWFGQLGTTGGECPREFQEFFAGANGKAVGRVRHNVGMHVVCQVESNGHPARTGELQIIIGDGWNAGEIGKSHDDGHRRPRDMRGPRKLASIDGGRERAGAH
jgi:hypothetical protein